MPRRALTSSWPAVFVAMIGIIAVLLNTDVPVDSLVRYGLYLVGAVALPGVIAWRLMMANLHVDDERAPTWFEDLSLGTIFGFGLQLPFFLLGVAFGTQYLSLALPLLAVVIAVATPFGRRVWTLPTGRLDVRVSWALTVIVLYGVAWLGRNAFPERPLSLPANEPRAIDETFHQALIAEVSNRFPPEIPFLLNTPLDYHWFVHAQIAASNALTGLESVMMLRVMIPTVSLVLGVVGLAAVALRLTGRPLAAFIAPALLVAGAYHLNGIDFEADIFFEPYLSSRFVSSPSHSYGVMMSMPALMLLLEVLRPNAKANRYMWVALTLALLALSGAKATYMPIFVCGAIGLWVIQLLIHRRIDRVVSALVALLIAVTLFAQFILLGGQTGGMVLDPFQTAESAVRGEGIHVTTTSIAVMSLALLVSWLLYGVGVVGLLKGKRWRDPRAIWMLIVIPTGIAVPFLLFRTGLSQLWFSRTVAELVVLISAWGLAILLPRPLTARRALALGGVAVAAGLGAFAVSSIVEARSDRIGATVGSLLLTVIAPLAVVGVFLVVWLVMRRSLKGRSSSFVVVLVTVLLGMGMVNVAATGHEALTEPVKVFKGRHIPLFPDGGVAAARYIDRNSSPGDIVATNVHCAMPGAGRCDNRNFWIAAFTERRIVVEGWGYTAATNDDAEAGTRNAYVPIPDRKRLEINDAAFTDPSPETVGRLVETYDVSWLFVAKAYPADIDGLKQLDEILDHAYENPQYVVFEVKD